MSVNTPLQSGPAVPEIVARVRERLKELEAKSGIGIRLMEKQYERDDNWLYLTVVPTKPIARVLDYADLLADLEDELRLEGIERVLLLPAEPG